MTCGKITPPKIPENKPPLVDRPRLMATCMPKNDSKSSFGFCFQGARTTGDVSEQLHLSKNRDLPCESSKFLFVSFFLLEIFLLLQWKTRKSSSKKFQNHKKTTTVFSAKKILQISNVFLPPKIWITSLHPNDFLPLLAGTSCGGSNSKPLATKMEPYRCSWANVPWQDANVLPFISTNSATWDFLSHT